MESSASFHHLRFIRPCLWSECPKEALLEVLFIEKPVSSLFSLHSISAGDTGRCILDENVINVGLKHVCVVNMVQVDLCVY